MKKRTAIHSRKRPVSAAIARNSAGVLFAVSSVLLTIVLAAGCCLALLGEVWDAAEYTLVATGLFHVSFRISALAAIAVVVLNILDKTAAERE